MTGGFLSACGAHVLTIAFMHWTWCELPDLRIESADCRIDDRVQIFATLVTLPNLRVSAANPGRIREGMTAEQVEELLGYPTNVLSPLSGYIENREVPTPLGTRDIVVVKRGIWIGVEQVITVDFGKSGKVEWIDQEPLEVWAHLNYVDSRSLWIRLRIWLMAEPDK